MPKKPLTSITIDTHIRCRQVFPPENQATYKDLTIMGVRLSREEALHLARAILAATQEWQEVELVVHRFDKRKSDNTYLLTVVPEHHEVEDPEFVKQIRHQAPKGIDKPEDMEEVLESLKDSPISD
ncbi:MAG: hypothetical protein FJ135_06055 [Deltaproteobacteria bacterium]|nr:hypothetical protein [Deltaproteobacteria bacterium]